MTLTVMHIAEIVTAKAREHQELDHPLTWPGFLRICGREGVNVRVRKEAMVRPAQLVPYLGEWTIVISGSAPARRHTYLGAHELAHLWLHVDLKHERWERIYSMDFDWCDDPREDEAEVCASMILMGPRRPHSHPDPKIETALQFALRNGGRVPRGPRP